MDDNNKVSLQVGGYDYYGWKSIRIKHSIETLSGVFSLTLHDRWQENTIGWDIEAGESCLVKIGSDVVITGYVDKTAVNLDANTHTITVEGRDRTADLIDCSAEAKEYANLYFEQIAGELIKPYPVALLSNLSGVLKPPVNGESGGKVNKKSVSTGETVHKVLEKLAKMQGVLLVSDRLGGLIITRAGLAGRADDALVIGENIKSINYENNFSQVYSKITVKGQNSGAGSKLNLASVSKEVKPQATVTRSTSSTVAGSNVGRYRPFIVQAEDQADAARCKIRAMWEASNREAKSKNIIIKVQGWRQSIGKLWAINTIVKLKAPVVREDSEYLIVSVEYSIDSGGTVTTLELKNKDAYKLLPEIPEKTGAASQKLTLKTVQKL